MVKTNTDIFAGYNAADITIGVLGSHSALDVCRGAKDEGFKTLVVCERGREKTYAHYYKANGTSGIVDHVIVLNKFADILSDKVQQQLRAHNVIFIPHRSFEVYLNFDYDNIENNFAVPMFGNRRVLRAEERNQHNNQYDLMRKAGVRFPKIFKNYKDINCLCLVKLPEKTRAFERAFFHCASPIEYEQLIDQKIKNNEIDESRVNEAVIEEFLVGPYVNFNYFYSPINKRLELLGTDTRRQTNVDGILRIPAHEQMCMHSQLKPKFEEAGHMAVTVLESMLEKVFALGEQFIATVQREYAPGIIGPFALQSAIVPGPPKKDIVVFDVSLRMPGSPGTRYTPYTDYLFGESLSAGRRVAREIKDAIKQNRLKEVCT